LAEIFSELRLGD